MFCKYCGAELDDAKALLNTQAKYTDVYDQW